MLALNPQQMTGHRALMSLPTVAASIILVVEDDSLVRLMAVDLLEDKGFTVIAAATADAAWAILKVRNDIAVVFTDVEMPGSMNGLELANHVAAHWPKIRLVITSGRLQLSDKQIPDHTTFVPKPYRSSQLLSAFNRI